MSEIKQLRLPTTVTKKKEVILTTEQIFNPKSNFSVVEKLQHLEVLRNALEAKLKKI